MNSEYQIPHPDPLPCHYAIMTKPCYGYNRKKTRIGTLKIKIKMCNNFK